MRVARISRYGEPGAGWVSFDRDLRSERATVNAMTETMWRRGPDSSGSADGTAFPARRQAMRFTDIDHAREVVASWYYPYEAKVLRRANELDVHLMTRQSQHLTVGRLRYSTEVGIRCPELQTAYHVSLLESGRAQVRWGRQQTALTTGSAFVLAPASGDLVGHYSADHAQLALKIDRQRLENDLAALLNRSLRTPIQFALEMDLTSVQGRTWAATVRLLAQGLDRHSALCGHPLALAHLEHVITMGLLLTQPHNYSELLHAPGPPLRPRGVQQVIELMQANPEKPWTAAELAATAQVGLRALQHGFHHHLGTTPMSYLRTVRLHRAHHDLTHSDPTTTTVAEIAHRWGFTHLSRFAAAYRRQYNTTPSRTLHAAPPRSGAGTSSPEHLRWAAPMPTATR
jgi:AraC-like DNA-binding protein